VQKSDNFERKLDEGSRRSKKLRLGVKESVENSMEGRSVQAKARRSNAILNI
jgi:hypothetical protein